MKISKNILLMLIILLTHTTFSQTWEFVGLDSMVIYNLQVKGDTIWAGTRDVSINDNSGLYKSIDQGQHWVKLDSSLGTGIIVFFTIDENNSSIIYMIERVSIPNSGNFYKTTNNGETWNTIGTPWDTPIKDFILSSLDTNEYYAIRHIVGHEGSIAQAFYKTTNGGENWEFKCCPSDQEHGLIMNFTMDKFNANVLYISGNSHGTFISKSTDRGETWENLSGPSFSRIFSDSFIQNRLYLFRNQYNSYSSDGGYSWQSTSGEFSSDAKFISFYQDNNLSLIYILLNEGLFYSINDSIYWKLFPGSDNLPLITSSSVSYNKNSISIDYENNYTYVGTSNGIFRTGIVTAMDESELQLTVTNYSLAQNYPNPFNPSTTIEFTIAERSNVSLSVFNLLGQKVADLVNENMEPGNYNVKFDASGLSSGVYLYQLRTGGARIVKKMQLLK